LPAITLCVTVDVCRSNHNNTNTIRSVLILSSFPRIFPPSGFFASGIPAKRLCAQFLCNGRHIFSQSRFQYNQMFRPHRHWVMASGIYRRKIVFQFSTGKILFEHCTFENETITVCRNVCNNLPQNVALYNRREVMLYISLWKPTKLASSIKLSSNRLAYKLLQNV
jgi:hypothetical protein